MGTVRPIKRVDQIGSAQLSSNFIGTHDNPPASIESSEVPPASKETTLEKLIKHVGRKASTSSISSAKSAPSSEAVTGKALIDEVILPSLQNVRRHFSLVFCMLFLTAWGWLFDLG